MPYTASRAPSLAVQLEASHDRRQRRVQINKRSSYDSTDNYKYPISEIATEPKQANDFLYENTSNFGGHRRAIEHDEVVLKLGQLELNPQMKQPRRMSLPADDDLPIETPNRVRKKSGELVKSCVKNRSKSAPATPTWPKYVHFDNQLEHVRHFLQAETPSAVLEDNIPFDLDGDQTNYDDYDEKTKLVYPNWSFSLATSMAHMISVESVTLSPANNALTGRVRVQNIAFQKTVVVRYTFDLWKTFEDIEAAYREPVGRDPQNSALDRFMFNIPIPARKCDEDEETTTMFFAVQYHIDSREFWDNNCGKNYQIDIIRPASKIAYFNHKHNPLDKKTANTTFDAGIVSLGSSPPSLSSSPNFTPNAKTHLGKRYNFGQAVSHVQNVQCGNCDPHIDDHQHYVLKRSGTFPSYFSTIPGVTTAASLEEALTPHIIHRSPRKNDQTKTNNKKEPENQQSPFVDQLSIPSVDDSRPAAWTTGYFDLINRYCFYNGSLINDEANTESASLVDPTSTYAEPLISIQSL
ncbi:hypothetical protein INT43_000987 [Umbelopsis isabellina]|uniref:CBM21 domain-containing protein n=1 Tax=Mortierella isabellina TaxID=91625 RepID=A0A8H7Q4V4_MORIS|nr:hypothetical protein INT43_000987 [Umbelopsis isabellina]